MTVQLFPFQCSMMPSMVAMEKSAENFCKSPAAKQLFTAGHDTPNRMMSRSASVGSAGLGLGTTDQLLPFHRTTRPALSEERGGP